MNTEEIAKQVTTELNEQESNLFQALMSGTAPETTASIEAQRRSLVALREREIMSNRLARAITNKKPLKKMSYGERLQLRIQVNRQLPESK